MSSRNEFLGYVRDDDRKRRDDSEHYGLQQQVDELRQALRELAGRCARLEENLKTSQTAAAQDRIALEQHQHDVSQAAQARQLEEARVRQQLVELSTRIDDSTRPIRTLQAHVGELIESVRRFRDEDSDVDHRIEELRSSLDHLAAHHERHIVQTHGLRDQIESLRTEIDRTHRDISHTDDNVKGLDHEIRRRANELKQEIEQLDTKFQDYSGIWQTLQVQIDEVREVAESQVGRIDSFDGKVEKVADEIQRVNEQARERDESTAERVEEVRHRFEHEIEDVRTSQVERYQRIERRIDDLEQLDRELGYRINLLEMTLDELKQVDAQVRREVWYLHEQRVRVRLEQVQEEMEQVREARRQAERQAAISSDTDNPNEE